jgi:hypothetical protein
MVLTWYFNLTSHVLGIFPTVPLVAAWNSNNIGGSLKRGVGIAMQVGIGNLGGVISAFVYQSIDQPRYAFSPQSNQAMLTLAFARFIKGHAILIGTTSAASILTLFMTTYLRRENARRDALAGERGVSVNDHSDEMIWQQREMGDDAEFFRYTV